MRTDNIPTRVTIVEVGPRDGLQNEPDQVPTGAKIAFVDALSDAGLPVVEVTSFVNPTTVPQLADATKVMAGIRRKPGVRYPVLVPNERGLERALDSGANAIALFTSATEEFAQANIRASIDASFSRFQPVMERAKVDNLWVRGYVSVAFGCPFHGRVPADQPVDVARRLFDLGCDEVCLADTIGVATPDDVKAVLTAAESLPFDRLALHFHDTGGRAIDNVETGLTFGISIFDAAAGGLGGCPFAPGAPGNLATEQLLSYLQIRQIESGVDLDRVKHATAELYQAMSTSRSSAVS